MRAISASARNSKKMKHFARTYGPSLALAAGIAYLSLTTGSGLQKMPTFENADKLVHFLMYACLAAALTFGLRQDKKGLLLTICTAIAAASAYGGLLELIQPYFPPRSCDLMDFIADFAGATAGSILTDIAWKTTNSSTR